MSNLIKTIKDKIFDKEFIKFGIVGVINTINHQVINLLLLNLIGAYLAHMVGLIVSMIGSFLMNTYFTYKTKPSLKKILMFPLTYLPTLFGSTIGLYVLIEWIGIPEEYASFMATIVMVPFSYIISSFILKSKSKVE